MDEEFSLFNAIYNWRAKDINNLHCMLNFEAFNSQILFFEPRKHSLAKVITGSFKLKKANQAKRSCIFVKKTKCILATKHAI